jgi:hypothetical protein
MAQSQRCTDFSFDTSLPLMLNFSTFTAPVAQSGRYSELGRWLFVEVIVTFKFMEELAGRDNIVTCAVPLQRAHSSALALKRAFDEGLGRAVVLIWERDIVDISWRSVGIDKHFLIALDEATPLKVGRNSLGCTDHIAVHALLPLGLPPTMKEGPWLVGWSV